MATMTDELFLLFCCIRYNPGYGTAPPGEAVKITRDQMIMLKKTLREQVSPYSSLLGFGSPRELIAISRTLLVFFVFSSCLMLSCAAE